MVTKKKSVKVANPDCDVATKGYVKCLIRTTRSHQHRIDYNPVFTIACAIGGVMLLFAMGIFDIVSVYAPSVFLFTIVCSVFALDRYCDDDLTHTIEGEIPKQIQEYIPPVQNCENPKE